MFAGNILQNHKIYCEIHLINAISFESENSASGLPFQIEALSLFKSYFLA